MSGEGEAMLVFLRDRIAEDQDGARMRPREWWSDRLEAECAAKLRVVENCQRAREATADEPPSVRVQSFDSPLSSYWRGQDWVCRVLALVYADHPDYREKWRPCG